TEQIHVAVLATSVRTQDGHLAVELPLEVHQEALEHLSGQVLPFCHEHPAVVGVVVHEIDQVPVAVAIRRTFFDCLPFAHVRQLIRALSVSSIPDPDASAILSTVS
ncbi:hypothetical protein PHYSODRAFT_442710, partial [Phytophthora sojae]